MLQQIAKAIPIRWKQRYRKWRYGIKDTDTPENSGKALFTTYYKTNHWQGHSSNSGQGSDDAQTQAVIAAINQLIHELKPTSILDLPCGDFHWMKHVNLDGVDYLGADIVSELIARNQEQHTGPNNKFKVLDITSDPLPKADLVICRDCFVHLSYAHIFRSIENIKQSGCRYLLTTSFSKHHLNFNIPTGSWRTLNLSKPPFSFPKPLKAINEKCTLGHGEFKDKELVLYEINTLNLWQL